MTNLYGLLRPWGLNSGLVIVPLFMVQISKNKRRYKTNLSTEYYLYHSTGQEMIGEH